MPQSSGYSSPAKSGASPAPLDNLALYELQKPLIEPMLRLCRLGNTALDILFYDVNVLTKALFEKGTGIDTGMPGHAPNGPHPLVTLDLTAATNPSGSVIVVDAKLAPYVRKPFVDMGEFFAFANGDEGAGLHTVTITGVGSSAYGSVAFAWDVSTAIGEPVAAVVPGYGLADVVPQALGGWFGFEMYDLVQRTTQDFLAAFAPPLAMMGKELALSTPNRELAPTGAPVFRHGSAGSDDIHCILEAVPAVTRLVGHSKGALAIQNAVRSIPASRAKGLSIVTLGCAIAEELPAAQYAQHLGLIDWLGALNSGSNRAEFHPFAHHSTNSLIPLSLPVGPLQS